jgi:hypothetical protein
MGKLCYRYPNNFTAWEGRGILFPVNIRPCLVSSCTVSHRQSSLRVAAKILFQRWKQMKIARRLSPDIITIGVDWLTTRATVRNPSGLSDAFFFKLRNDLYIFVLCSSFQECSVAFEVDISPVSTLRSFRWFSLQYPFMFAYVSQVTFFLFTVFQSKLFTHISRYNTIKQHTGVCVRACLCSCWHFHE